MSGSTPPAVSRSSLGTLQRIGRNLADILRYARPHWKPFAIAVFLMSIMSFANVARVVLVLPVIDRVAVAVDEDADEEDADRQLSEEAALLRKKADSTVAQVLNAIVMPINAITESWVPDSWVEDAVEGRDLTPEQRDSILAVERDRYATLFTVFLLFLLLTAAMCAATYGESYLASLALLRIVMDVRESVCRKLLDQPVAFFDDRKRGDLVGRTLGDVGGYAAGLGMIMGTVRSLWAVAWTIVILLGLSPILTLTCLLGIPFLLPMRKLSMRTLKRAHKRQQESVRLVEILLQIFSGVRTVKAFGSEERRVREFRATDEGVTRRALKVQRTKSQAGALVAFINNVLAMTLAVGGGWLILRGALGISLSELLFFMLAMVNLYQPIKRTVRQSNDLLDAMASIERTTDYLSLPPGSPDAPDAQDFGGVREVIRFENVSFAYVEDQPVLRDVSFEIPVGATVALVGPSGGGKSTLCDLLLRFYDPSAGRLTVDGKDVREFKRATYLARTAAVTQTPFLFHISIRDNIRQGRIDATDEQIVTASKAAYIHEHIEALPAGYDEEVGEQGVRLSGGQLQRITIARALVRNPEILVLDEATSSLDTASEQAVQNALERLRQGRTTLVVAHRLSTIRDADQIVVLNEGSVVERGKHDELIGKGGLYSELVKMQDLSMRDDAAESPAGEDPGI